MKRRNRWVAWMMAICLGMGSLGGCSLDEEEVTTEDPGSGTEDPDTPSDGTVRGGVPTDLQVNRSTGEMSITRNSFGDTPMGEDGTWTIFVYLCGADLESDNGMATGDLQEMIAATASDSVRYVVQTGGAYAWDNDLVDADKLQRFVVEDNDLQEVYSASAKSMGDVATVTDFLRWGVQEYPAEHMGVIFWDHGSGSINGFCFDETDHDNGLSLRDLNDAFYSIADVMTDRFEFVGFDACLMGSVEAANILAPYARYMIGSEEIEPGYGWDYEQMGDFLAGDPDADGAALGKVICDSFYAMCEEIDSEDMATLAVVDLDRIDEVLKSFNTFAKDMYDAGEGASALADMVRKIENADNFGGNNRSEGYTNMVDLGGLVSGCAAYSSGAGAVLDAIDNAVVYKRIGSDHGDACGLSTYYPLSIQGSEEMKIFGDICISPYYLSFIDRQGYDSYYDITGYGDSTALDDENTYYDEEEGIFYFMEDDMLYACDVESEEYYYYDEDDDEWYLLDDDDTSAAVDEEDTYYDEEEGIFYFIEDGVYYAYDVEGDTYYYYDEDEDDWYELTDGGDSDYEDYSDDYWYDDEDLWSFGCYESYYDEGSGCYRSRSVDTDRWDYADDMEVTGESKRITFAQKPALDEEGTYSFTLNAKGIDNAALVYGYVFEIMEEENDLLLLGETYDIYGDWDSGHFEDGFEGYWLSLPDGQNLSTYIVDYGEDYIIYTSPVEVNGEETNLRLRQDLSDYSVTIEGIWNGLDENGIAARDVRKLEAGDEIVPLYVSYTYDDAMEEGQWKGAGYTVDADTRIVYDWLDTADYLYAFCIDDLYGDYYMSDFVTFNVDENGDLWFYEE